MLKLNKCTKSIDSSNSCFTHCSHTKYSLVELTNLLTKYKHILCTTEMIHDVRVFP